MRLREEMSCASPEGQTTIGLGRCGLEGMPIQGRHQGVPTTNRGGGHLRKNAILLGVKQEKEWSGGNTEGSLGWALIKLLAHARQRKQRREKGLGFKKGTLALGMSMPGTMGTKGAST